MIPKPPTWISPMMTTWPNGDQYVAVSTVVSPVTHTAETLVNAAVSTGGRVGTGRRDRQRQQHGADEDGTEERERHDPCRVRNPVPHASHALPRAIVGRPNHPTVARRPDG